MDINFTTFCRLMLWVVTIAIVMLSAPIGFAIVFCIFGVNAWITLCVSLCSSFFTIFAGLKLLNINSVDKWIWRE